MAIISVLHVLRTYFDEFESRRRFLVNVENEVFDLNTSDWIYKV